MLPGAQGPLTLDCGLLPGSVDSTGSSSVHSCIDWERVGDYLQFPGAPLTLQTASSQLLGFYLLSGFFLSYICLSVTVLKVF